MLGTLAAPSLLGSCTGSESDKAAGISFAMNYFKVSEGDLRKVLAAALEKGGDYADLFFEHSYRNNVGLQDGAVNRASSNIDFGMGVRVLSGDQTGYAYVENVSLDEMLKAARTAARIATGSANTAPINLTEEKHTNNFYSVQTPWDEIAINDKMPFLQKLNDQIFAKDKRVTKVMASLGDTTSHILFCNSEGQIYYDYRPMSALSAVCIMEDNGKIENSYAARAFRMGAEFLTDDLIDELAQEAVDKTSILFQAIKPKGGEMPVVMGAGGSGILLHGVEIRVDQSQVRRPTFIIQGSVRQRASLVLGEETSGGDTILDELLQLFLIQAIGRVGAVTAVHEQMNHHAVLGCLLQTVYFHIPYLKRTAGTIVKRDT